MLETIHDVFVRCDIRSTTIHEQGGLGITGNIIIDRSACCLLAATDRSDHAERRSTGEGEAVDHVGAGVRNVSVLTEGWLAGDQTDSTAGFGAPTTRPRALTPF